MLDELKTTWVRPLFIAGGLAFLIAFMCRDYAGQGLAMIAGLIFYFLPALVGRSKRNAFAIFVLNLFLGWTVLGWVIALVWAVCHDPEPKSVH